MNQSETKKYKQTNHETYKIQIDQSQHSFTTQSKYYTVTLSYNIAKNFINDAKYRDSCAQTSLKFLSPLNLQTQIKVLKMLNFKDCNNNNKKK